MVLRMEEGEEVGKVMCPVPKEMKGKQMETKVPYLVMTFPHYLAKLSVKSKRNPQNLLEHGRNGRVPPTSA